MSKSVRLSNHFYVKMLIKMKHVKAIRLKHIRMRPGLDGYKAEDRSYHETNVSTLVHTQQPWQMLYNLEII